MKYRRVYLLIAAAAAGGFVFLATTAASGGQYAKTLLAFGLKKLRGDDDQHNAG
jgi:hypothetical protein